MSRVRLGAAIGLAAACAGLGVAQLAAAAIGPGFAPIFAVSDAFVDLTPSWLKNAAVSAFGTHDKTVLILGAGTVVAALAAGAGVLALRRARTAMWLVIALGALASLAAVTRPDAGKAAALPSLIGAAVAAFVLDSLGGRARALPADELRLAQPADDDPRPAPAAPAEAAPRRRALLLGAGGLSVIGLGVGAAGWLLGERFRRVAGSRSAVRLPSPADPAPPLPAGADLEVTGLTPVRVPNDRFYRIDTALLVPQVAAEDWRLRVHGMVEREVELDFAELLAGPLVERDVTLACVSNPVGGDLIGNALWLGLPIADLLRRARPAPDADMVLSTSADGWTAGTPLAVLLDGRDALLAVGMNGEPLPVKHGFPVRMVVPGLYGYVSATKWVVDLKVTRFDRDEGYWTPRGWSALGPVKTQSRIDVPRAGSELAAGPTVVAGVAWAQHTGVAAVEVQVDDEPWRPAELAAEVSLDTWRQWRFDWAATPGKHRLRVRATDKSGYTQTAQPSPVEPDGATGHHEISIRTA